MDKFPLLTLRPVMDGPPLPLFERVSANPMAARRGRAGECPGTVHPFVGPSVRALCQPPRDGWPFEDEEVTVGSSSHRDICDFSLLSRAPSNLANTET